MTPFLALVLVFGSAGADQTTAPFPRQTETATCSVCRNEVQTPLPEPGKPGFIVECHRCGSIVDIYQADTAGDLHRPPWFLRLQRPLVGASPMDLWTWVRMHVKYERDGGSSRRPETWQLAHETYSWRRGDCEDSAILLADWLRSLGHDAYVVAGQAGSAGHAWVVLHHDGETYLLETTGSLDSSRRVPPLAGLQTAYNPTLFMFDDRDIWIRRGKGWTADYRSPRNWHKLAP